MEKLLKRPNGQYWTPDFIEVLEKAQSYKELVIVAFQILEMLGKNPNPIVQICGPISTGGKGSLHENIAEFNKAIFFFSSRGENVFDQMPFQIAMERLSRNVKGYDKRILNDFYLPLFESGIVKIYRFLPGWRSSKGARWENRTVKRLQRETVYQQEIIYLRRNWSLAA